MKTYDDCKKQVAEKHGYRGQWPQQQFWKALKGDSAAMV